MDERERFYKARDSRSRAYLDSDLPVAEQIQLHLPDGLAESQPGQIALLALSNQLARFHRRVHFIVPDGGLTVPSIFGEDTLVGELQAMVTAIDPYGVFTFGSEFTEAAATVSIGSPVDTGADIYAYWDRWIGGVSAEPFESDAEFETNCYGAATAAVLSAAAVLQLVTGSGFADHKLSLWNFRSDGEVEAGPKSVVPLDVGRVLMVGAGAVASCLTYWLALLGNQSEWTVVDEDDVTVSSTNRGMLFTAENAGWPDGDGEFKVDVLARTIGDDAEPFQCWFHDWTQEHDYDLALCLANDHGVRTAINHFPVPVIIQATTGNDYLAQLHRHVAGQDDCVHCRMVDVRDVEFVCGETTLDTREGERIDAALPFLSAAAGLQLVGVLHRLAQGDLHQLRRNTWRWHLALDSSLTSGSAAPPCECPLVPAEALYGRLFGHSRFGYVTNVAS